MIEIVVSQKIRRHIFLSKMYDKKDQGNKKRFDAGQKNDARWDDKLMICLSYLKHVFIWDF